MVSLPPAFKDAATSAAGSMAGSYALWPELYRTALTIRLLEAKFLDLFAEGRINGTVHTCCGQELIGPAVARCLGSDDFVVSNHRGHGHFVACTGDDLGLVRELMGRTTGVSGGIGGSQHLCHRNFLSNGIQGGMVPVATGMAMASRMSGLDGIAVAFIGDGTLGEGALYEALNAAGVFDAPLLLVLENNGYAQSTATCSTISGSIEGRAKGFGAGYWQTSIWQPDHLIETVEVAVNEVRTRHRPVVLDIGCYRLNPHSKGDDNRDPSEIARYREIDPLNTLLSLALPEVEQFIASERLRIDGMVETADGEPVLSSFRRPRRRTIEPSFEPLADGGNDRINTLINEALGDALEEDKRVILLGEDICDRTPGAQSDYGGAFKVTKGLSTRFPDRVLNFPISESTMVGVGTGLALRGFRPVVEIMFGDFLTLCFDQLLQHAAKFSRMFNDQVRVPLIVRTPMGGKRGYGPTHSQSIEKFFVGIPGLQVVALNDRIDPREVYRELFGSSDGPTLVIENKVLYTRPLKRSSDSPFRVYRSSDNLPALRLTMDNRSPEVTVFCYGELLESVEQAAIEAFVKHEIVTDVVCPMRIHPLDVAACATSLARSGRLVTVEEGPTAAAIGAELIAELNETGYRMDRVLRVGNNLVIPSSVEAEKSVIPGVLQIKQAIVKVANS